MGLVIKRESEFYQGYIRVKLSVTNESPYVATDVELSFLFDEELLHIDRYEPLYTMKNAKFILGNIDGGKSKSIAIYFEPLMCSKGTDINCLITYKDYTGKFASSFMESKSISVICPIIKTDSDINIGRLKEFIDLLPSRDSRIYEIQKGFDINKLVLLAREVLERHDLRHIRTLRTKEGKNYEIWYYGKAKVTSSDIVIKISLLMDYHTIELFTATESAESLTGLLAEMGRGLKQSIESKISGNGNVINVTIKDSVVQRTNLLDNCNLDGTCDANIVVENSVIQRLHMSLNTELDKASINKQNEQEPVHFLSDNRSDKAYSKLRGQTENSGRAGHNFGHRMGEFAAKHLGTELIRDSSIRSNEAFLQGDRVVIKSAHKRTTKIGVPHNVLDRVDSVIAVLEDKNGSYNDVHKYSIYKISSDWFKSTMTPSHSSEYAKKKVGMTSCSGIRYNGEKLGELTCDF